MRVTRLMADLPDAPPHFLTWADAEVIMVLVRVPFTSHGALPRVHQWWLTGKSVGNF